MIDCLNCELCATFFLSSYRLIDLIQFWEASKPIGDWIQFSVLYFCHKCNKGRLKEERTLLCQNFKKQSFQSTQ